MYERYCGVNLIEFVDWLEGRSDKEGVVEMIDVFSMGGNIGEEVDWGNREIIMSFFFFILSLSFLRNIYAEVLNG